MLKNTAHSCAAFLLSFLILFFIDSPAQKKELSGKNPVSIIDSLKKNILNYGWNNSSCFEYQKYIINSELNAENEMKSLSRLPSGVQKDFIRSLLLKKQSKFKEMNELLSVYLEKKPQFYSFYNELVFSAAAADRLSQIESAAGRIFSSPAQSVYKNYLLALINVSKGKYRDAVSFFSDAVKKDSSSPDIILQFANAYRNSGDYRKAYDLLKKHKEILKKDAWFFAGSLMAEGSLYFLSADYKKAEELYRKGYEISLRNSLKETEAKILVNLGIIDDLKGYTDSARRKFNEAADLAGRINDREGQASAYSESGVSYSFTNDLVKAKRNYTRSFEIYKLLGNRIRLSLLCQNLGKISLNMFNYREAIEFFNEGLNFAAENKRARVLNLTGLADCYSNLSNYTKALIYYGEAGKIASEINELALSAEVDYGMGVLNFSLDRFGNALKYFHSAKKDADAAGNPFLTADINHKIGISYFKLDSLDKAGFYLKDGYLISKKYTIPYTEAQCLIDLAALAFSRDDFNESEKYLSQAKTVSLKNSFGYLTANALLLEGKIAEKKNYFNTAQEKYRESLKTAGQLREFNLIIESEYLLAKLFEKNNLDQAAESYFKSAVKSIDEVSEPLFSEQNIQISYFAGKREVYDDYAEFLLNRGHDKEAFELIDNSRSRNTMRNLANIKLESLVSDKSVLDKIYETEWGIASGIYGPPAADSLKAEYKMLTEELITKHPEAEKYLNPVKKYSVQEIQGELSPGENLISIYSDEKSTYIFRLSQKSFYTTRIQAGRKEIMRMVSALSPYFSSTQGESKIFYNQDLFSFNIEAAFRLYEKIIKPSVEGIPFNEKLIFSPSPDLLPVPIELLVTKYQDNESAYDYSGKDYLIYHYDISYTPSVGVYIEQKYNNLKNNDRILIAGDPSISGSFKGFNEWRGILDEVSGNQRSFMLMPLKYSGEEINQISSVINADKVLAEDNATESNFKSSAEMSKLIHLTTHSFLLEKQPLILFSNKHDPDNDGFLEAGEIVKMKLNSDLVVLSSCNSGLGEIDPSEGIIGMTKAFFEAGAKSIVVSLWDVNDKYTSRFMGLFYRRLSEGYDKSKALRRAKIDFINEYSPNPYYWGAFILSGNINPVSLKKPFDIIPYLAVIMLAAVLSVIFINIKKRFLIPVKGN